MIQEILFTVFIWPIYFILETLFVLFVRIFASPGYAIIFLSVVVSTLCIPLFKIAERWQKEDRQLQEQMKPKLDNIRSAYKGDKRQMIINTYYRQMGYSPVSMLKSSMGLLLQVPFFIAAYQFLSGTGMLPGVSFIFIKDLGATDALFGINILPILMTVINLISSIVVVISNKYKKIEFIKLAAMSLIFLILLYNSPSGLVLYWTMNNIYSLFKNVVNSILKKPGIVIKIGLALAAAVFIVLIITGKAKVERFGILFIGAAVIMAVLPFIWGFIKNGINKITQKIQDNYTNLLFYSSIAILFLLIGVLNPAQVLASSVSDFETPWLFLFRTILQGFSFLVLVPLAIWAFSPANVRNSLTFLLSFIAINALICYFALFTYYGIMDRNFKLEDTNRLLYAFPLWVSLASPFAALVCVSIFTFFNKKRILSIIFQAVSASILVMVCINLITLGKGTAQIKELRNIDDNTVSHHSTTQIPVYFPISKIEPNVFIVFLDRAQGSAVTDVLEYMPSLKESLDGFVFYPNTISFGASTVIGVPSMLGGYDYIPQAINERQDELLKDKVNNAISFMPRHFGQAGYRVSITDPVIANLQSVPDISIFNDMPNVTARLLSGKLTHHYLNEFSEDTEDKGNPFDFDILFRYGIFRTAPPALRYAIYYKGQWWREVAFNSYGRAVAEFSSLYYLPQITQADNGGTTLNIFMNYITHESGSYNNEFFPQSVAYKFTSDEIEKWGSEESTGYIYALIAGLNQLVKWFDYLKSESVYDNTRIILVSDHGGNNRYKTNRDTAGMEGYNPMLMVKDFDSRGLLTRSEEFMTHSDTPYLAAENLGIDGIADLETAEEAKANGITVFGGVSSQPLRHGPYLYNLTRKRTLHGKDVLDAESWGEWERY